MSGSTVAVVGATGAVGQELLALLAERNFPVRELRLLASARSAGKTMSFGGEEVGVQALGPGCFQGVDVALFSAGGDVSRQFAPQAVEAGAVVVDNSSAFRLDAEVPLVVPEVNGAAIADHQGILANPNCSTILLVMALAPLHRAAGLQAVCVSTYQAASGAGQRAMEELRSGLRGLLDGRPEPATVFPQPLAGNLFPHVDRFESSGYTREEDKMLFETRRILDLPELPVEATCVRVPVERCHSEAVTVRLDKPLSVAQARELFATGDGLQLQDEPDANVYPMPLPMTGTDAVAVGRVRPSRLFDPGLTFWLAGDQLRKGAALNAVQIAERL
ncbi:MAG: aspartate-semialdehyde dehydrogenase [Planctomycetota bacterium]|nr:aspartate-semialdehyde dehydrogenase [Planctomycetota bacterium]